MRDHSQTYKDKSLRNLPHRYRLGKIKQVMTEQEFVARPRYADVGCSNGFITAIVGDLLDASSTTGFDRSENLAIARENFPELDFQFLDLNEDNPPPERKYEVVTCFETIEHVGKLEAGVDNLLKLVADNGTLVITVPIEIGRWGIAKYIAKRSIYRYTWPLNCTDSQYFRALLAGDDISKFRYDRSGHGSHFGFDYRRVDRRLAERSDEFTVSAYNDFTTRFYIIRKTIADQGVTKPNLETAD